MFLLMKKINPDSIQVIEDDNLSVDFSSSSVYASPGNFLFNLKKFLTSCIAFLFMIFLAYAVVYEEGIDEDSYLFMGVAYVGPHLVIVTSILSNILGFISFKNSLLLVLVFYIIFVMGVVYRIFYAKHIKYSRIIIFKGDEIIELNQTLDGGDYEVTQKSDILDILVEKDGIEVETSEKNYVFDIKFFEDIHKDVYNFSD